MTDATPLASEQITQAGRFLLDRLVDHEVRITSDEDAREWHGHVTPAMARFRAALSATPAPSGQDETCITEEEINAALAHGFGEQIADEISGQNVTGKVKWRERWYGSEPEKGSAITDERGNLVAYFGGDEATHAAVTKIVTQHNAALSATPAPSDQGASQAQGEVERFARQQADHWLEDMATPSLDARHVSLVAMARNCIRFGAALSPAPGATAQDGVDLTRLCERVFRAGHDEGWTGNQMRRDTAMVDADKGWALYVNNGALAKSIEAATTPTPTIPAGMVAKIIRDHCQHGVKQEPFDGPLDTADLAETAILAMLAAAPEQAEQQGVAALRAALQDCRKYFLHLSTMTVDDAQDVLDTINAALNTPTGAVEKGEAK